MATYTEKELEEIIAKYGKDISFTELDCNNTYLIKIEYTNTPKDQVAYYCQTLKNALNDKGIKNVIILPVHNNNLDVKLYKLEKEKDFEE